jgi:hypothetical protein
MEPPVSLLRNNGPRSCRFSSPVGKNRQTDRHRHGCVHETFFAHARASRTPKKGSCFYSVTLFGNINCSLFHTFSQSKGESTAWMECCRQFLNSTEQSPWEANSRSARQEMPRLLWKLILECTKSRHWTLSSSGWIQSTSSYTVSSKHAISMRRSYKWSPRFRFPGLNPLCISHLSRACFRLIPFDLITFMKCGEEYKLWGSLYKCLCGPANFLCTG